MKIVEALNRGLPDRYVAEPQIHLGSSIGVDRVAFEEGESSSSGGAEQDGGVATAVGAPPEPTRSIATGPPGPDEYEVRVYDSRRARRLVAAIEIVSPANKDRPETRRAFVTKCSALIRDQVCVAVVDLVTTRSSDFHRDLMDNLGLPIAPTVMDQPELSAVSYRWIRRAGAWSLESWAHVPILGQPLPTLPLWLASNLALPLELEATYEETCRVLRIA